MDKTVAAATSLLKSEMLATEMMTVDFTTINMNDSLRTAITAFKEKKLDTIPVVDNKGILVGVLPRGRLFQALLDGKSMESGCAQYIVRSPRVLPSSFRYNEITFIAKVVASKEGTLPVVEENGKLLGMIGRLEYLRATLHLAAANMSKLESTFQSMHEGIITVDKDGWIVRINHSAEGMFGIEGSEIIGHRLHDYFPGLDYSNKRRLGMRNTLMSVPVIVNQVPWMEDNKYIGVMLVFLDLSYEESIAQELGIYKELQNILGGVLGASSDGVIVTDRSGSVKYANDMAAQLFALTPEQMMGKDINKFLGVQFPQHVAEIGDTVVETLTLAGRQCIAAHVPIMDQGQQSDKPIGIVSTIYLDDNKLTDEIARKWISLQKQVSYYRMELEKSTSHNDRFNRIVSKNNEFMRIKNEALRISRSNSTVLITGESGVGKDMFARAIHLSSSRAAKPFIKVNCAAIPETLIESELFGYAPGSFTGASKRGKPGYFEQANHSTIFLDEIGDMPLSIQVKLLQVLQDKEFTRVGGTAIEKVDVRVIAATNRDLREEIEQRRFREDLFYRLNVIELRLPSLRDRPDDIILLAKVFIDKYNSILGTQVTGISKEAQEAMKRYIWPGNIRELENAIERAANYVWEGDIQIENLPPQITRDRSEANATRAYESAMYDVNRRMIMDALKATKGNKSAAARLLNISRTAFYEKMAKYVLDGQDTK